MNKTIAKRLEALEHIRARAKPNTLLGVITYSDGTEEKIYCDDNGVLQSKKTLDELIGFTSANKVVQCTITEAGKEHTLFSVLFQLTN